MATFVTNYANSAEFFTLNSGEGPGFLDIEALGIPFDGFAGNTRVLDIEGDQNAFHVTGTVGVESGEFHAISGNGTLLSPTSWNVNGLVFIDGPFYAQFSSTAGLTLNPPLTDSSITGTINSALVISGVPGGFQEFDFTGALAIPATGTPTFSATQIHFFSWQDNGVDDDTTSEGTISGAFTVNLNTEAVTGTITSLAMSINGNFIEASGFSIQAATFFAADTAPEVEALYGLILAGNDAITSTRSGGHLDGFAGNDTLTAGNSDQILNGGAGADVYEIGSEWGGIVVAEGVGQGTDTVRAGQSFTLQENSNIENLILTGSDGNVGYGNALANTIVGNSADNELDGRGGADSVVGGGGNDTFFVDNAGDKLGAEAADGSYDLVHSTVTHTLGLNFEKLQLDGEAAINGTGSALDNELIGNQAANVLSGMGGDDSIDGNGGNDKIDGGDGNDDLGGADGSNTILGGAGDDDLSGGISASDNNLLDGGAGNDELTAGDGANTLLGGAGNDNLESGSGNDLQNGGDGDDELSGGDGANTLLGGAGNDELESGTGNDFMDGGAGNDDISGGDGANSLYGGMGDDSVRGSSTGLIDGGAGNDSIEGGDGGSTLLGGAGNDSIYSSNGADVVDGGAGIDTHVMNAGEVTITLAASTENLTFTHTTFGSEGIGNALANVFTSGTAIDHFDGKGGNDTYNLNDNDSASEDSSGGGTADLVVFTTLTGSTHVLGSGIERLTLFGTEAGGVGNELANVLTSGADNNSFDGKTGNDTYNVQADDSAGENDSVDGGGNDLVIATLGDEEGFFLGTFIERLTLLHAGEGEISGDGNSLDNVITGANNADNVLGGHGGADTLIGGALDDELYGDAGADSLLGGAGNDWLDGDNDTGNTLVGGAGDDSFVRYLANDSGSVTLIGSTMTDTGGSDTVFFSVDTDDSSSSVFSLNLATQAGFSMIDNLDAGDADGDSIRFNFTGNAGNNTLVGSGDNDTLSGGAGNDWLDGGNGADSMLGGLGDDSYVLRLLNGAGSNDVTITDLSEVSDSGGTGDVMVLTSGDGIGSVIDVFTYTIGADTSSPFEGIDASRASINFLYFNLTGNTAGNLLIGGRAADTAGGGHDTLTGGLGNDTYGVTFGDTVDEVTGGGGNADLVIAYLKNNETWNLGEGIENLTLVDIDVGTTLFGNGNALANRITGDSHADNNLFGGNGIGDKDTLIGGAGNDTLVGGDGADSLVGGLGDDMYVMDFGTTSSAVAVLPDALLDTGGNDTVVLLGGEGVTLTHTLAATIENLDAGNLNATGTQKFGGNALDNNIYGSGSADSISGGAGNDSLDGYWNADTLLGGAGDDRLDGGEGSFNDVLDGGAGSDSLNGGDGADTLIGGDGNDDYIESTGDDTYVIAQAGDEVYIDGDDGGTDTLIVKALVNEQTDGDEGHIDLRDIGFIENATYTGAGAVRMYGNEADNVLTANAGNDYLDGGDGSDTLTGGAGNDELYGGVMIGGDDSMNGGAGNDSIDGGEGGADTLIGGDGSDVLHGGQSSYLFDDVLVDPDGNDYLDGGAGNDSIDGGEGGADTLIGGTGDDSLNGGTFAADGVEMGPDVLPLFSPDGDDFINGGAGNDTIDGGEGGADTLMGELGNDSLNGGQMALISVIDDSGEDPVLLAGIALDGNDYLDGGAGNDTIDGGEGGADTLIGGDGNDILRGGIGGPDGIFDPDPIFVSDGGDYLDGGAGNDSIDGGEGGADTLIGNAGNDTLYGGSDEMDDSNDSLSGGAGNDQLDGGYGADTMSGGAGNDTYQVDNNDDKIVDEPAGAAGGTDTVIVNANVFVVGDNIENITFGANGGDVYANAQANTIVGNSAGNLIAGGGGNDTVTGGAGADTFVLGWGSDTITGGNVMAIKDYHVYENMLGGDLLGLNTANAAGFSALFSEGDMIDGAVTNGTAATADHAQLIYTYGNATTPGQLFYDADGTGAGAQVLVATFAVGSKPVDLHESNFVSFGGV